MAARREDPTGRRENAISGKSLMHGRGESYHGVVPTKQPNQSGEPPAEVAEGRPLTKENTLQPNPCRTPRREIGRSGLAWVCQAASKGGGATPPERALRRQAFTRSEVGTVCASSASTGLCGGQRVTAVPTATDASLSPLHLGMPTRMSMHSRSTGQDAEPKMRALRQPAEGAEGAVAAGVRANVAVQTVAVDVAAVMATIAASQQALSGGCAAAFPVF